MYSYFLLVVALYFSTALAQVLPFSVTGFLGSATANAGTALNRGGSVTVSGFNIIIPDNLLVEFPALMVPFAEFTAGKRAGPNEVSITGNIVNDQIIAGQMAISQLDLAGASGVVESLNPDGRIKIKNGPTIRINDPNAKYSAGYPDLPFFTADDENPSISSFSGFPMCVPSGPIDPKCPEGNRPPNSNSFIVANATQMVPIRVGDFLEYSGAQVGTETICYAIVVNIDVQTSGSQPGYVRVEDALIGIADVGALVEAARYRFVGLASRSDLPITIWAIDQDPCTGVESDRLVTTAVLVPSARNKWEARVPKLTNIGLYTRNYRVKIGDNVVTTQDGIDAGQYVQPVTEWIFPELVSPGAAPPAFDFSNIGPLKDGFGPINGQIFGQLKPWPGAAAPPAATPICPDPMSSTATSSATASATASSVPLIPAANAGTDQTVLSGVFVSLAGSQSTAGIPASELSFAWFQIAGPPVSLSSLTSLTTTFVTPVVPAGSSAAREFQLVITHVPTGVKANDTVVVVANRAVTSFDHPIIDSLTWATRQGGTATASVRTELVDSTASMRIIFGPVAGGVERPMVRGATANGKTTYTFNSRSIPTFTQATVRSYINNVLVPGPQVSSINVLPG